MKRIVNNLIGWISSLIIVLTYFLLSCDYLDSKDIEYNILNAIGGIGLAYRVLLDKNYSNFILEVIFIGIAFFNVIRWFN